MSEAPRHFPSSPSWAKNTKLFVTACVILFLVTLLTTFGQLVLYIILALVLSLVLRPIVDFIDNRITRFPRWLLTALIYLLLLGGLLAIPLSTIPSLVRQVAQFIADFPNLLELSISNITEFLREPISILGGRYYIPVNEITVDEFQQYLGQAVSVIGGSLTSFNSLVVNITSLTLNFVSQTIFILFLSFYFTKDGRIMAAAILKLAPDDYQDDVHHLLSRSYLIWGAFLRGQVTLMLIIGIITFIIASILGLPNPVALAVIAGLLEVIPYIGPALAAIPAGFLAWFQYDTSWLGGLMTPFWFTALTLGAYWLIQQIENYVLLPRIMGHQLKLHPAFVFVAVLAGWQIAGISGIFLASPALATMGLFGKFIYGKLTDQTMDEVIEEAMTSAEITPPLTTPTPPKSNLTPAILRSDPSQTSD